VTSNELTNPKIEEDDFVQTITIIKEIEKETTKSTGKTEKRMERVWIF